MVMGGVALSNHRWISKLRVPLAAASSRQSRRAGPGLPTHLTSFEATGAWSGCIFRPRCFGDGQRLPVTAQYESPSDSNPDPSGS